MRFTKEDFWHEGIFKETIGKNGLYVLYYGLCFGVAVVFGTIFLLYITYSRTNNSTADK